MREQYRELILACVQCGTCAAACPTSEVSEFHVRRITRRLQLDMEVDLERIPWLCTQCARCVAVCDDRLDLPALIMALRRVAIERGLTPAAADVLVETIRSEGSPYRSLSRTKSSWIDEHVRVSPEAETLCWLGCTPSIMSPGIARATARVLDRLCGGFRMLEDEPCCGEPLIALGLFQEAREVALRARDAIVASGARRVVTSCAGCYTTFTSAYPEKLGVEIPGVSFSHVSQLLASSSAGGLRLERPMRAAYHDPCSLGRHAGVYDAPREVLSSIEGLELFEMDPTGEQGLCCGGGGGLWSLDRKLAMEMASKTIEKGTRGLELDAIVTCCPMCHGNFRHTLRKAKSPLRVLELTELVSLALGDQGS